MRNRRKGRCEKLYYIGLCSEYPKIRKGIVSSRVLEDDYITIYGTSVGTITYQSTMGGNITIPAAIVDKIDQ